MKSAFDKIAAGLGDAIAYANGDNSRGRTATIDVKAISASDAEGVARILAKVVA